MMMIESPIFTWASLLMSPSAVVIAQPMSAATSKGTSFGMGVTRFSDTIA